MMANSRGDSTTASSSDENMLSQMNRRTDDSHRISHRLAGKRGVLLLNSAQTQAMRSTTNSTKYLQTNNSTDNMNINQSNVIRKSSKKILVNVNHYSTNTSNSPNRQDHDYHHRYSYEPNQTNRKLNTSKNHHKSDPLIRYCSNSRHNHNITTTHSQLDRQKDRHHKMPVGFAGPLWKSSPAPSRVPPPVFLTECCNST